MALRKQKQPIGTTSELPNGTHISEHNRHRLSDPGGGKGW